jgi:hypothetical protein
MRNKRAVGRRRLLWSVLLAGVGAASVVVAAPPSSAVDTLVVSPRTGPSGGGNTIIATTGGTFGGTNVVQFSYNECPTNWRAPAAPANTNTASPNALTAGIVAVPAPNVRKIDSTHLSIVVPKELALLTSPSQTSATYHVCVYTGETTAATLQDDTVAGQTYTIAGGALSLSTYVGPNRGGNMLTASTPMTFAATPVVQFQAVTTPDAWTTCAPTYPNPAPHTAGASPPYPSLGGVVEAVNLTYTAAAAGAPSRLSIQVPSTLTLAGAQTVARFNVCAYASRTSTSTLLAQSISPYTITTGTITSNADKGPSGGGNSLTLSTTAFSTGTFAAGAVAVQFQYAGFGAASTCSPTWQSDIAADAVAGPPAGQIAGAATAAPGDVRVLAKNRLVVTAPATLQLDTSPPQTSAAYHICLYTATGGTPTATSTLIGASDPNVPYSIGTAARIDSVTPTAGSAQGGTMITVYGANFPSTLSANDIAIGGTRPFGDPLVAANGNSFTVLAPPHAVGGPVSISVTTAGGTTARPGMFTYTHGIVVMPNTAPLSQVEGVNLDIRGVGFDALDFGLTSDGTTPNNSSAHVYLVDGQYNPGSGVDFVKGNGQVAECVDPLVIAPDELICTLYPAGNGPHAQGSAPVVCTCDAANNTHTLTAGSGTPFLPTHVGMTVDGPNVPDGTVVQRVISNTSVEISSPVGAQLTGATVNLLPARTVSNGVITTANLSQITSTSAAFTTADNGRQIVGPGIPPGTTLTQVNGTTADLSQPATAAGTGLPITIGAVPIPIGTYTVTVVDNGQIAPTAAVTTSVISSGSTFTVADY